LFFEKRFFIALFSLCGLFVVGHFLPLVFIISKILLYTTGTLVFVDFMLLYSGKQTMECTRNLPNRLSMSDENKIQFTTSNFFFFPVSVTVIDELPIQFQIRDFKLKMKLLSGETKGLGYTLIPRERGEFEFGLTRVFVLHQ